MSDYGVTPQGFVLKRQADIQSEVNASIQADLGSGINLDARSPLGMIIGILTAQMAKSWEALQATYYAAFPNTATGTSLVQVCSINNVTPKPATYSTSPLTITGDEGTVIGTDFQVSVEGNASAVFANISEVTIPSGGTVATTVQCTTTGPVVAAAGSLTTIVTPLTGVDSVTNASDATLGSNAETPNELRARRLLELQRSGTATVEGIRNAILNIAEVSQANVFENVTNVTDPEGRPPKSFEDLVVGGDLTDIAQAIFEAKAAGIQAYGNTVVSVPDSQGITHAIGVSRPVPMLVYITVELIANESSAEGELYPDDGDDQVKAALVAYGATLKCGQDIVNNKLYSPINTVAGIIGLVVKVGTTPNPTSTANLPVPSSSIAQIAATRINVVHE
jgi:uncharacterized phage protein gp47/JayE